MFILTLKKIIVSNTTSYTALQILYSNDSDNQSVTCCSPWPWQNVFNENKESVWNLCGLTNDCERSLKLRYIGSMAWCIVTNQSVVAVRNKDYYCNAWSWKEVSSKASFTFWTENDNSSWKIWSGDASNLCNHPQVSYTEQPLLVIHSAYKSEIFKSTSSSAIEKECTLCRNTLCASSRRS